MNKPEWASGPEWDGWEFTSNDGDWKAIREKRGHSASCRVQILVTKEYAWLMYNQWPNSRSAAPFQDFGVFDIAAKGVFDDPAAARKAAEALMDGVK